MPALAVAAASPAEIQRELAWRQLRLELSNAILRGAVTLCDRSGRVRLAVGDAELKRRRISGIYWADNPVRLAESI